MIQFNTNIEDLKKFILENGSESNWNYTESLMVENILIKLQYEKYKVVLMRYYKNSCAFYYADEISEWKSLDYIEGWFSITI